MNYENDEVEDGEANETEHEESRELTYEEIWDDSALIDAWNAAAEEYEVCIISCINSVKYLLIVT
jgi:hypothetical protein